MFMTEKEFNETVDLLSGRREPSSLLDALKIWAKEVLGVDVYNYFCDYIANGPLRLRLVLWDYAVERKMHEGPNLDKKKQELVAEKFAQLARLHHVHNEYWDAENIFVCYETIRDEIQKDILKRADAGIRNILHPDIWKIVIFFEGIHIFYETDEQVLRNKENGTSDEIRRQCTQFVKMYDVHNAFLDGANCTFTSRQTLDEKYSGNMYYYYHG